MQRICESVKESKQIGYCKHHKHPGYMTVQSLSEHQCIKKNCPYFEKNASHMYWTKDEKEINKKKLAKFYRHFILVISQEDFFKKVKKFYGAYENIPKENGQLKLDDFVKTLPKEYVWKKGA